MARAAKGSGRAATRSGAAGRTGRAGEAGRELARRYARDALKELHRLALEGESETVRLRAAQELLDRAYGTSAEGEGNGEYAEIPVFLLRA